MKAVKSPQPKRKIPSAGRKLSVRQAHAQAIKQFHKAFAKLSK
jgi:hypothetical protein